MISEIGDISMLEELPEDQVNEKLVFVFAFCDSCQIDTRHKYNVREDVSRDRFI